MQYEYKFRKVLIVLMLVFSISIITACENTKVEDEKKEKLGEIVQTSENSKSVEKDTKNEIDYSQFLKEPILGITDDPIVKKAEGALVLNLGVWRGPNFDLEVDYIDPEVFFFKPGMDLSDERYADVTKDGKVDWTISEKREFEENPSVLEMLDNITIDGEKATLPMKFSDLGEEYAIFDRADFSHVTEETHPFRVEDLVTKNQLMSSYKEIVKGLKGLELLGEQSYSVIKKHINMPNNNIASVLSDGKYFSKKDIRVKGIGIGNTLNEVYDQFGLPTCIDNNNEVIPRIRYNFENKSVLFMCYPKVFVNKKDENWGPKYTITGIAVYSK